MTRNEFITLRMNMLGGMNTYMYEKYEESEILNAWYDIGNMYLDSDEEDFKRIAENDKEWSRICALFGTLVNM